MEEKWKENWTWDAETKIKPQGLFAATKSFEDIVAFSYKVAETQLRHL